MSARSIGTRSVGRKVSSGRGTLPPLARIVGTQGPCRCRGEAVGPHHYGRTCWERGREPLTGPGFAGLHFVSDRELEEIRETAHADGYAQAEHDLDDDRVPVGDLITAMRKVKSSKVVREALAYVLGLEPADLDKT